MQESIAATNSAALSGADDHGIALRIDLRIPSSVSLIDGLVESITELIQVTTLQRDLDRIELALREAVSNAIVHGNGEDPSKIVAVRVTVNSNDGVRMSVKDQGEGFDPASVVDPTQSGNKLRSNGRGVFLIKQLMDNVGFHFEQGTEVVMRRAANHS